MAKMYDYEAGHRHRKSIVDNQSVGWMPVWGVTLVFSLLRKFQPDFDRVAIYGFLGFNPFVDVNQFLFDDSSSPATAPNGPAKPGFT